MTDEPREPVRRRAIEMSEEALRGAINREVSLFSRLVLFYDRDNPGDARMPGEILKDFERRAGARDAKRAAASKWAGNIVGGIVTALIVSAVIGLWPSLTKLMGHGS